MRSFGRKVSHVSKLLIIFGAVLIAAGFLLPVLQKIPGIGRFPGDVLIKKENFTFYFPITTCILASLILTFLFSLFWKK